MPCAKLPTRRRRLVRQAPCRSQHVAAKRLYGQHDNEERRRVPSKMGGAPSRPWLPPPRPQPKSSLRHRGSLARRMADSPITLRSRPAAFKKPKRQGSAHVKSLSRGQKNIGRIGTQAPVAQPDSGHDLRAEQRAEGLGPLSLTPCSSLANRMVHGRAGVSFSGQLFATWAETLRPHAQVCFVHRGLAVKRPRSDG